MLPKINTTKLIQQIKTLSDVRVIGLILFGVVAVSVAWSSLRTLQLNYELQKKEAVLAQTNQNSKLENENLSLKNAYFETEEYLELTARRQFSKAAPGEQLYLVPKEVALSHAAPAKPKQKTDAQKQEESKSKYQKNFEAWMDFLLHSN